MRYHHDADEDVVITARVVEDFSVATRKPRENAWAGASSETDAGAVEGAWIVLNGRSIGEAAPCHGVHSESAADARAALRRCAAPRLGVCFCFPMCFASFAFFYVYFACLFCVFSLC